MLRYLSKFLTDILPPVAATVIGAWIVAHYISPKPAADHAKAEASAQAKPALNGASGMVPRAVETVAVKPVAEEGVETKRAARDKSAPQPQQAKAASPRIDDRRDATDMARAALERLRQQAPAEAVTRAVPANAVISPIAAPAAAAPVAATAAIPAPAAAPALAAPALPPPLVISAPRDIQPIVEGPARPVPPAEIPMRPDAGVSGPAAPEAAEKPSLIGGLASAAKSLVETVIPR